ncbi:uncharacterized protein [Atheta coriaria]|uniref:uncharacterized protein n=1 Tax=Dalotia coriaria TaxID=877792 RepID=UPI0031F3578D
MGDMNARIGNTAIKGIKQRFNESDLNDRGEMLIEFCAQNELRINNTFYQHKLQHKITFSNNRGDTSMIDFIVTNRAINPSLIEDVCSLTSANINSDHNLVLCKTRIHHNPKKIKVAETRTKYNIESLRNESTMQLYEKRLKQHLISEQINEEDTVEITWQKILNSIKRAADEAIGSRTLKNTQKKKSKPWYTPEVKEITALKRQSYLTYKSNPTTDTFNNYKAVRNSVNTRIREIQKEFWAEFYTKMQMDFYGAQKLIWKVLRSMKREVNEDTTIVSIEDEKLMSHFKTLYGNNITHQAGTPNTTNRTSHENTTLLEITEDDTRDAMKELKNRKSPDEENVTNELIKGVAKS